ncbi:MAG: M1 family metallopeptidase, partial [Flavobacteriaceae bacterium]|nr:M1 family metallopeptidase [Flavobacteriaceae bacterium]
TLWHYDMKQPMSSYLVALAIGKYKKYEIQSESGIPIEMYAYQGDDQYAEPTYRFTKQIFDFLEQEIGVPYPWQNYKQVPVKDFLYAGMENTTLTIFSDNLLTDKTGFLDQNYVNVNAHELAHHWFGDLVTETHGTHHWLHEGFATYYALLAEKDVFGENYYYYELYKTSRQLVEAQKTDTIPLMNPKASSLTFYQKGAWALHRLREIIGDKTFKTSVKRYLNTYQFKNVETDNFINIVEQESKKDLSGFVDTWLKDTTFPEEEVKQSLSKNKMCRILFDGIDLDKYNTQPSIMLEYYPVNYELVDAAVEKPEHKYSKAIIEVILNSPPIEAYRLDKIRQYLAGAFPKIPEEYKKGYETLLSDPSYITKESALINLWINFPEDRAKYLDATKGVMGFKDKSLRSLWLALATVTEGYDVDKKNDYFFELIDYTSPKHGFDVRRHAFVFLDRIQGFNEEAIKNLLEATRHHNWRFKKNAKNLLKQLKKNPNYTKWIEKYE